MELFLQTSKRAMKRFLQISALSLLMLAFLSFFVAADVMAQGKSHKHHEKDYKHKDKKGGPPDWAPAHGYRRKGGEDDCKHHKCKDHDRDDKWEARRGDDKEWKQREEELKRREEGLKRREEEIKRRERGRVDENKRDDNKRRPEEVLKKRRSGGDDRFEEIKKRRKTEKEEELERRQDEIRRRQEEVSKGTPIKKEPDWTGGTGW